MISVFFPGGTRTRVIQLGSLVYMSARMRQNGVDSPWNVISASAVSVFFAWAAYIGLSALEARRTIQYFTSGEAGADAIRHAMS